MKRGFTLVELSIVLVIIGLLIGGILVAQSMISTSKLTATVAQLQQFDAGMENFKTKYGGLPGDAKVYGGDGDGIIDSGLYPNPSNFVAVFVCEIANFWNNLNPEEYPGVSTCPNIVQAYTTGPNKNVPLAKFGKTNSFYSVSYLCAIGSELAETADARKGNYYFLMDSTQAQTIDQTFYRFFTTTSANSAAKPSELLALDAKIDDKAADTGNVLSGRIGSRSGDSWGGIEPLPASGTCSLGANYLVANQSYECTPLIRIGAMAGDLQ